MCNNVYLDNKKYASIYSICYGISPNLSAADLNYEDHALTSQYLQKLWNKENSDGHDSVKDFADMSRDDILRKFGAPIPKTSKLAVIKTIFQGVKS